ncbi:hypothetical protein [Paenibacillus kandeliae]|uniref:hypothetical protein n=1 Tax=Paenibacillus kandeliae TaxID=3231269 RepID=UPI003459ABB3
MKLKSESIAFQISTTDLEVTYTEAGGVEVRVDGQSIEDSQRNHYRELRFHFTTVAELRCTTLNFFETCAYEWASDGESTEEEPMSFWKQHGFPADSRLYEVVDSTVIKEKGKLYDPLQRLQLKHFLLIGYDSYVEVIAAGYTYSS